MFKNQLTTLRKTSGAVLRIDHTYKFSSILGGWSTTLKKWVCPHSELTVKIGAHASLLIILNENGSVLAYKIVSNDKRDEVYNLLLELWNTPERKHITLCVYTDNPKVDESFIQMAFEETKPEGSLDILYVLLDIFHAKTRVTKELPRSHPDRKGAMSDFSTIFAKLHHYSSSPTIGDLQQAFTDWKVKYSTVHAQLTYSLEQKIELLGNSNVFILNYSS